MMSKWSPDHLPPGLLYAKDGPVVTITLARPDRLNALTFDIYQALHDLFSALAHDKEARAVILTGQGRGFCSGGDVEDIIGKLLGRDQKRLEEFTRLTCSVIAAMRRCPQPIIAALNGVVAGAGAALAIASDFRLAVPEAHISLLFVKVGLSGADMGAAFLLPRLVGLGRATELLMVGDRLEAQDAHRIGLYNRIVPPGQLAQEATNLAQRLAQGPGEGLAVTKRTLDAQLSMTLEDALEWDANVQAQCMLNPDFQEAYEAFRAKRRPVFGAAR